MTGIDTSKLQRSRDVHCHLFPPSSTFIKSTYLFLTRENRGKLPQPRSRRWKIEYLVPVERPETSWNWSNIQPLLVRARRCAFNTNPERRMFLRWQKIIDSMPIKYVCRVITVQRSLQHGQFWYEISRQKVPCGFYGLYRNLWSIFFFVI